MRSPKMYLSRTKFLVSLLTTATLAAHAATIKPVTVEEMLIESKLVIDGTVLEIVTEKSPDSDAVFTIVTFQVYDVIKGLATDPVLKVRFLGGIADGAGMHIPGLIYPEFGERGIYFLEDPTRNQINPIFGWDQGHFIVDDPGAGDDALIHTIGFGPIYGVFRATVPATQRISNKTAIGIQTEPNDPTGGPMTIGEFKTALIQLKLDIEAGSNKKASN